MNKDKKNKKVEIVPGFYVGDTVILTEKTELTQKQNINLGTVGVVSKDDNLDTLSGWVVVNVEESFRKEIDKMSPEKIDELYNQLSKIGKIKNYDKMDEVINKKINK
jgi:hypothetical protein